MEQLDFPKIPEMCVKMIRRVNDEEGIKVKHCFTNLVCSQRSFAADTQVVYYMMAMQVLCDYLRE